jgi:hypothetical protein
MVAMGKQQRVREARLVKTTSFASASDPDNGVVMEIFLFEPQ